MKEKCEKKCSLKKVGCYSLVIVFLIFMGLCFKDKKALNQENNNQVFFIKDQVLSSTEYQEVEIIHEYSIEYILEDDSVNHANNPKKYTINDEVIFLKPTRIGYIFNGWYDQNETLIIQIKKNSSGNLILTPNWNEIKYSLIFEGGSDSNGTMEKQVLKYNESALLNKNGFFKLGFKFDGWLYKDKKYQDEEIVKNLTQINEEEIVLEAIWISKLNIGIDVKTQEHIYDGKWIRFDIKSNFILEGFIVEYYINGVLLINDLPMNAGSYEVHVKRLEDDTYKHFESAIDVGIIIKEATIEYEIFDFKNIYDGKYHSPYIDKVQTVNNQEWSIKYSWFPYDFREEKLIWKDFTNGDKIGYYELTAPNHRSYVGYFTINIKKSSFILRAEHKSSIEGKVLVPLTYLIEGSIFEDDVLTGNLFKEVGYEAGKYEISRGTLKISDNYDFQFIGAQYDIFKTQKNTEAFDMSNPQNKYLIKGSIECLLGIDFDSFLVFKMIGNNEDELLVASKGKKKFQTYSIALLNNNNKTSVRGNTTVKFQIPKELNGKTGINIIMIEKGILMVKEVMIKGSNISFSTTELGNFSIIIDEQTQSFDEEVIDLSLMICILFAFNLLTLGLNVVLFKKWNKICKNTRVIKSTILPWMISSVYMKGHFEIVVALTLLVVIQTFFAVFISFKIRKNLTEFPNI